MSSGVGTSTATLTAAFLSALQAQGIIILTVFVLLAFAWIVLREAFPPAARAAAARRKAAGREPRGRLVLRAGFGVLWLADGLLQVQPAMPAGLPSQVIEPGAASSPAWVQHVVSFGGTTWSYHPVQAAASAVWIQVGIGVWLLAARRGWWSRLAGLASFAWGLTVWVFGEAFGQIFAPGQTLLFGAPGAAAFYCAAGLLVAAPQRLWRAPQLGRRMLAVLGVLFAGMAVLQAWPGRGFWQGPASARSGTLTSMVASMAGTSQPSLTARWVRSFGSFTAAHGFAVNLTAVCALALIGTGLALAAAWPSTDRDITDRGVADLRASQVRRWLARATMIALVVFCLADWVLIEDFGVFGGLGTDPGSMIPVALLGVSGYLALRPAMAGPPAAQAIPVSAGSTEPAGRPPSQPRLRPASVRPAWIRPAWIRAAAGLRPARLAQHGAAASAGVIMAAWAVAVTLVGAVPLAAAQASPNADPIIARALNGDITRLDGPAPAFRFTDQNGRPVSLASLHGKVVLLTFLDPVCTTDCPLMAQELKQADQVLGARSRTVELVAIVANPVYRSAVYTRAFDTQEHLAGVANWRFLTGSLAQLQQAWKAYGVAAQIGPAGGMIGHPDLAYVIDARGRTRAELNLDPGPGTSTSVSSFAVELSDAARQVMK